MGSKVISGVKLTSAILILTSYFSCSLNEDNESVIVTPFQIGKGELYGAGKENILQQNIVITDTVTWIELKNKMNSVNNVTGSFTETEIDFSQYIILASFSKLRNTGGYSIEINRILEYPFEIIVTVKNLIPSGFVPAVITQPYHIVKIPKTGKEIIFN